MSAPVRHMRRIHTGIILQIIPDEDIQQNLKVIFQKFRFPHKVYRARHPEKGKCH